MGAGWGGVSGVDGVEAKAAALLEEACVIIMVCGRLLAFDASAGEDPGIPEEILIECTEVRRLP